MEVDLTVAGVKHTVALTESSGTLHAEVSGHHWPVHVHRRDGEILVAIAGQIHAIHLADANHVVVDGRPIAFSLDGLHGVAGAEDEADALGPVRPPMMGTVAQVVVNEGDLVAKGDVLFILEAMKMRNEVHAPAAGVVSEIHVMAGATVEPSTIIMELDAP